MIDLYLFNTIINTIWYIFTILFVLYRFTSVFSYIYNFIKFCYKLFDGANYILNKISGYINYPNNYTYNNLESQTSPQPQPTFFQKCKNYIKGFIFKTKKQDNNNNLYYIEQEEINLLKLKKEQEYDLFNKQMDDLSEASHSNYDPPLQSSSSVLNKSNSDYKYFNHYRETTFNTNSNLFYSVNLNDHYNKFYEEIDDLDKIDTIKESLAKNEIDSISQLITPTINNNFFINKNESSNESSESSKESSNESSNESTSESSNESSNESTSESSKESTSESSKKNLYEEELNIYKKIFYENTILKNPYI